MMRTRTRPQNARNDKEDRSCWEDTKDTLKLVGRCAWNGIKLVTGIAMTATGVGAFAGVPMIIDSVAGIVTTIKGEVERREEEDAQEILDARIDEEAEERVQEANRREAEAQRRVQAEHQAHEAERAERAGIRRDIDAVAKENKTLKQQQVEKDEKIEGLQQQVNDLNEENFRHQEWKRKMDEEIARILERDYGGARVQPQRGPQGATQVPREAGENQAGRLFSINPMQARNNLEELRAANNQRVGRPG